MKGCGAWPVNVVCCALEYSVSLDRFNSWYTWPRVIKRYLEYYMESFTNNLTHTQIVDTRPFSAYERAWGRGYLLTLLDNFVGLLLEYYCTCAIVWPSRVSDKRWASERQVTCELYCISECGSE